MKKGFTIIEIVIVFLLILGVVFLVLPSSFNNTKQAKLISKWAQTYSSLEYMFSAVKAQQDADATNEARNIAQFNNFKKCLRITTPVTYTPSLMNGQAIDQYSPYYFDNYYKTSSNEIVGIKLIDNHCQGKNTCSVVLVDINGQDNPNKWGYDVFGANITQEAIEPIGKGIDSNLLRRNCNRKNEGYYCSYYYLIGGKFD